MKYLIYSIISISMLISCSDDTATDPAVPIITSIAPATAKIGDVVTVYGSKFGTTQGTSFVTFNNIKAIDYITWSDTEIKVKIPTGATSGRVWVTKNGTKSNEVDFIITGITPGESVSICNQVWMIKNLNVSQYRNGDTIPEVTNTTVWRNLTTGAWCYYNNDTAMGKLYGKLYNWYAVNDPRGLAPEGWHVPSDAEWTELTDCLGGEIVAGGKLKSKGTIQDRDGLWWSPNKGATNESGFSALPGGWRNYSGTLDCIGYNGVWWSATEYNASNAWDRSLHYFDTDIKTNYYHKAYGRSVRCVKD